MKHYELIEQMRLRYLAWGGLSGFGLGLVYPLVVVMYGLSINPASQRGSASTPAEIGSLGMAFLLYGIFAALIGLFVGGTAGWFNGLVAAALTRDFFRPLRHILIYRALLASFSGIIALIFAAPVFLVLISITEHPNLIVAPGILIAIGVAIVASQHIASWVEDQPQVGSDAA